MSLDNIDIINQAREGNRDAFVLLFEELKNNLAVIALTILKNKSDVDDALQDTCLSAYTSISRLKKPEYFKTWITRILINHCYKIKREQKNVVYLDEDISIMTGMSLTTEETDLLEMIDKLSDKDKNILLLRYFNDMKMEEMARVLHCSVSTVKSRLYRATEKLKVLSRGEYVG